MLPQMVRNLIRISNAKQNQDKRNRTIAAKVSQVMISDYVLRHHAVIMPCSGDRKEGIRFEFCIQKTFLRVFDYRQSTIESLRPHFTMRRRINFPASAIGQFGGIADVRVRVYDDPQDDSVDNIFVCLFDLRPHQSHADGCFVVEHSSNEQDILNLQNALWRYFVPRHGQDFLIAQLT